ncbi:MAG: chemotaxis protein CheX [Syntrophales bacterium]|nr:chemotaxis protein CheX [Syntrophales bacterium]
MLSEEILQRVKNSFRRSIFEVMEKMYFVFLEPTSDTSNGESLRGAEVNFSGPWEGKITVLFSPELIHLMINNLFGLEEGDMDEKIKEDTIKECVNMIAGSFLRHFEPERAMHLSIPSYLGLKYAKPPQGEVSLAMDADRGRMYAILDIRNVS